jgi:hydrogenase maturation protease
VILVIACGNPLRQDDGVGWHVAERLRAADPPGLGVLTCHQLTPELAEPIAHADRVVFVDASTRGPAGRVESRRVAAGFDPAGALSHALTPAGLLGLAAELYGRTGPAWCVTVAGQVFGHGADLSPAVEASVEIAARRILRLAILHPRHRGSAHGEPVEPCAFDRLRLSGPGQ